MSGHARAVNASQRGEKKSTPQDLGPSEW